MMIYTVNRSNDDFLCKDIHLYACHIYHKIDNEIDQIFFLFGNTSPFGLWNLRFSFGCLEKKGRKGISKWERNKARVAGHVVSHIRCILKNLVDHRKRYWEQSMSYSERTKSLWPNVTLHHPYQLFDHETNSN